MIPVEYLIPGILRYRVDILMLFGLAFAAVLSARRFAASRHADRRLSIRMWLVSLGPVAFGSLLAEWATVALALPDLNSVSTVLLSRIALLGAFGAVSALLLVDTVQLAMLRSELESSDDARKSMRTPDVQGTVPAAVQTDALRSSMASVEIEGGPDTTPARRPRVLIVDDLETNRFLLEIYLQRNGFDPQLAASGREAIDLAAANEYDVILMDVQMPDMDGCAATREIRAREAPGRHTPIFALTAAVTPGTRERCLAAGMDEYLTKPIDLKRFKLLLGGLLKT